MLTVNDFLVLEKKLNYVFVNRELLKIALTHSSYTNDDKLNTEENYERMEFFGDSILQFLVSEMLFSKYDIKTEGKLTKLRALVVCEETLAKCAKSLSINKYIIMSNGSLMSGGRDRPSILADVIEAIICSIFLDGGMDAARKFIKKILKKYIELAIDGNLIKDYKSALQEHIQGKTKSKIEYILFKQEGPVHDRIFEYLLLIDSEPFGQGLGKTKKEAQQHAAKQAIEKLNLDFS